MRLLVGGFGGRPPLPSSPKPARTGEPVMDLRVDCGAFWGSGFRGWRLGFKV